MNCTHCNTKMEREERSRGLPFSAERHSQDEMRRRENLQQRVVEAERRAQEESRRADQAQQRAREIEGICVRMSIQLQIIGNARQGDIRPYTRVATLLSEAASRVYMATASTCLNRLLRMRRVTTS